MWIAVIARDPQHQRQMAAGRAAGDADTLRINAPVAGMVADVAHGSLDVGDGLGDGETRLAAVTDGEYRVAALEWFFNEVMERERIDQCWLGEPAAADKGDDGQAIGALLRHEHVH